MLELHALYRRAVEAGIEFDPRGRQAVERFLARERDRWKKLEPEMQEEMGREVLSNPYIDTRVLYGERNRPVKKVMVGIDIGPAEVVAAKLLNSEGAGIDALLAHHPEGKAFARLHGAMHMQSEMLHQAGLPINVAEGLMGARIDEVGRRLMPHNFNREVDMARLFDLPYFCVHTPSDNAVSTYLQEKFDHAKIEYVEEIMKILRGIEEYQHASLYYAGPKVVVGKPDNRAGKVFVDMTGGTSGNPEIYKRLVDVGIGTVVCMHLDDQHFEAAGKAHLNVVVAGHIASDTLGMNLILDVMLEKQGIEVVDSSGFRRVQRKPLKSLDMAASTRVRNAVEKGLPPPRRDAPRNGRASARA